VHRRADAKLAPSKDRTWFWIDGIDIHVGLPPPPLLLYRLEIYR
jgi:hypothetical protein